MNFETSYLRQDIAILLGFPIFRMENQLYRIVYAHIIIFWSCPFDGL